MKNSEIVFLFLIKELLCQDLMWDTQFRTLLTISCPYLKVIIPLKNEKYIPLEHGEKEEKLTQMDKSNGKLKKPDPSCWRGG